MPLEEGQNYSEEDVKQISHRLVRIGKKLALIGGSLVALGVVIYLIQLFFGVGV